MNSPDPPDKEAKQARQPYPRVVESTDLFGGNKLVLIHHENDFYRLTVTRNGKLILQK